MSEGDGREGLALCAGCKAAGRLVRGDIRIGGVRYCKTHYTEKFGTLRLAEAERMAAAGEKGTEPMATASGAARLCSRGCGRKLRSDNKTGVCAKCQQGSSTPGAKRGRPRKARLIDRLQNAPAGAYAKQIELLPIEDMHPRGATDEQYLALFTAAIGLANGNCLRAPVPTRAAATKNPAGAVRAALAGIAESQKDPARFLVSVREGHVYVAQQRRK